MDKNALNKLAVSATLHCLTGCAIGEVAGLIIGTELGLATMQTVLLAVALAFIFGFALSSLTLVRSGMKLSKVLPIVLAADSLSIAVMEIVDNAVMLIIPGALDTGISDIMFWFSLAIALTAAFFAALPVNRYLITKNKGHALMHDHHHH